jgi:hypothetical protein
VVDFVPFGDTHELGGVWSRGDPYTVPGAAPSGAPAFTYADGCDEAESRDKDIPPGQIYFAGDPVTVFAGYRCSPVGTTEEERDGLARRALQLGEERALEALFATGVTANGVPWTPPVSSTTLDVTSQIELAENLGGLERTIAVDYGGVGVLHVPYSLAELMASYGMLRQVGDGLKTFLGTRVAVNRYLDAALDASVPVLYGGPIVGRRTEVTLLGDFREAFDFSDNTVTRIVERTYVFLAAYPNFDS